MELNLVDQYDVFELNPDMVVNNVTLPNGITVIEIENYYKHPEKVKALAGEIPLPSVMQSIATLKNGYKAEALFIIPKDTVYKKLHDLIRAHNSDPEINEDTKFTYDRCIARFNIFNNTPNCIEKNFPHIDPFDYVCITYLNKVNYGTTVVLQHKETGAIRLPVVRENDGELFVDEDTTNNIMNSFAARNADDKLFNDYDIIYNFKGGYNSMVILEPRLIHASMIDFEKIKEDDATRVIQVSFLNKIQEK